MEEKLSSLTVRFGAREHRNCFPCSSLDDRSKQQYNSQDQLNLVAAADKRFRDSEAQWAASEERVPVS